MATSWLGASLMMRTATASLQMFNSHFDVYSTFGQNVGYYFYYSKKFIKKSSTLHWTCPCCPPPRPWCAPPRLIGARNSNILWEKHQMRNRNWLSSFLKSESYLGVLGQHFFKGLWHRVAPEEIVVESSVRVDPGWWVECEKSIEQVDRPLVLHVRLQPLLHSSLLDLWHLHLTVQVQLLHPRPHLWANCPAQLGNEGELVLFRVALHDWTPRPHLCHDTSCPPHVDWRAVVSLAKQQLRWTIPESDHSVGVPVNHNDGNDVYLFTCLQPRSYEPAKRRHELNQNQQASRCRPSWSGCWQPSCLGGGSSGCGWSRARWGAAASPSWSRRGWTWRWRCWASRPGRARQSQRQGRRWTCSDCTGSPDYILILWRPTSIYNLCSANLDEIDDVFVSEQLQYSDLPGKISLEQIFLQVAYISFYMFVPASRFYIQSNATL